MAGGVGGERYHDRVVSWLTAFAVAWSILGMLAGVYVAAELVWPTLDFGREWLSYGRLRTLHTNSVIFGFGVSALMGTAFYSVQRTCHVPLFAPRLAWFCALAWQVGVLAGGISLLAGWNGGKEYAELEWPFDIAIAVVWVCFAIVFFGTIAKRRIQPIYVSNWFYGGLIIVIAMLHIVNSLAIPVTLSKSYSLFAGAQDAIVQWWYGHKRRRLSADRRLSWACCTTFCPSTPGGPSGATGCPSSPSGPSPTATSGPGPHHLHYNAVPEWVQSLGMVMSLVLLAPSWATLVNGVMTVAGAWEKLRTDPALKFIVLSLAFYGLATFEGPMMSIKSVNVVSHFTDWTIGHVHSGALGWNAMITFGAFYFLVPRLVGASLYSIRLANIHFWLALAGTLLYVLAMWGAGVSQGLLWLSLDEIGELSFSFKDIMASMAPYYALRLVAGLVFLAGAVLMAFNLTMTGKGRCTVGASPPANESGGP